MSSSSALANANLTSTGGHNGQQQQNDWICLYSSKAHVFQINPETKNSWLAKGDQAIPISFVATIKTNDDTNSKRELKIVGTSDNGDTVLDAAILAKTNFTKRTQKFGQWIDHTGAVYGLGFGSETELIEFVNTFHQLQRDILSSNSTQPQQQLLLPPQQQQQSQPAAQADRIAWNQHQLISDANVSETNGRQVQAGRAMSAAGMQQYSNTLSHPGHQQTKRPQPLQQTQGINPSNGNSSLNNGNSSVEYHEGVPRSQSMFGLQGKTINNNTILPGGKLTPENESSPVGQTDYQIRPEQLKYENERMKHALEESSKTASLWHSELMTLRTNNVKLTQALQESKAHVAEWERELFNLRDENKELKLRIQAIESDRDPEKLTDYKKDIQSYKNYVEEIQGDLRRKDDELDALQKSMEELELKVSAQNGQLNESASSRFALGSHHKHKIETINAKLEAKTNELVNVQKEFARFVDQMCQEDEEEEDQKYLVKS